MLEVTIAAAVVAGLLSFLSPCVLPMVPFYISYLAGSGMSHITAGGGLPPELRRRAVLAALIFAAGMLVVFVGLGATATILGQFLREWFDVLRYVAAAIIIAMGLHFLGVLRIPFLYRQFRADTGQASNLSLAGAFVVGMAFAFGWVPCVGPSLAAILFMAGGSDTVWQGMGLLLAYGIGMTAPFVLAALFVAPFMRWMTRFRRHLGRVEKAMGAFLVLFGLLVATNSINYIANWMLAIGPDIGVLR